MRLSVSKMECSGKVKSTIAVAEQRSRRFCRSPKEPKPQSFYGPKLNLRLFSRSHYHSIFNFIIMLHINNQMPEIGKIFGEIGRSHEGNCSCDMIYIVCQPFRRIKKIAV